ncbi:MATE family efflux transporter [Alkalihalobacillus pseudalcaliphilus]|uniref:MATE family efflux transporter n=1 Tax=Alkalihalobacillus pseudalcaliphilus TaxID=79884 RepID=UPI00064DE68C|nr:MATE family efflux transporter [Alkalihalobacillus pseudalcaliphilus]KMK76323.1 multidrug transporter MatE [Alkalihalobacillus pseudalcaliphilus]
MSLRTPPLENQSSVKDKLKIIILLAIPAVIENFFQTLLGFVDTLFVAKIGLAEVSAVGVTNAVLAIYFAVFMAVGVATNVLISNFLGAGKVEKARHIAQQAIVMAIALGIAFGIITLFFADNMLLLMGLDEEVLKLGSLYFKIVGVPSIFMSLMFVLSSILRGAGDTKSPMKTSIMVNIINVILDFILIFGFWFIPAYGIVGAALASVFARLYGTILLFRYINKTKDIAFRKDYWKIDKGHQIELLSLGSPAAIERLAMRVGQIVYFGFIVALGTNTFAAHQIAGNIEVFSYMIAYGFAAAATILVGRNIGANNYCDAKEYAKLTTFLAIGFMSIFGILLFLYGEWAGSLFTEDPKVIAEIGIALKIAAVFQPFLAVVLVLTGAYQGANNTKYPMYLTIIGMWLIRTGTVYLLAIVLEMGLAGVWIAIGIDIVFRAIILWTRFTKDHWVSKTKDKIADCHPRTRNAQLSKSVNNY